jgi:hypothetical protein
MQGSRDQPLTSPHLDPERHGTTFGRAVVTVDLELGDCIVRSPHTGPVCTVSRTVRFNSLDEIRGAYSTQMRLAKKSPTATPYAADIARALKHAGQRLKAHQERK